MADDELFVLAVILTASDKAPFLEWLASIKDKVTKARMERQIQKLSRGLGFQKAVGGVSELKIDFGPGYRVYYARVPSALILLIGGGDKSTQNKDIADAIQLLADFEKQGKPATAIQIPTVLTQNQDSLADPQDGDGASAADMSSGEKP